MCSVLITGINGYIGQYLALTKPDSVKLKGSIRSISNGPNPVLTRIPLIVVPLENNIEKKLDKIQPSIIIHTAAMANLAECERLPGRAMQINAEATKRIAVWCAKNKSRLIYLSTDIVFSGKYPPYDESSEPDPINVYGRSKLAGELSVGSVLDDYAILRIALALGRGLYKKQNFIDWLLKGIESEKEIGLFDDEVRTPTAVYSLSEIIWQITLSEEKGIFHLCSTKSINRYRLGQSICQSIGKGINMLKPIQSAHLKSYPRPLDVSLRSTRTVNGNDLTLPDIETLLDSVLKKYV